MLKQDGTILRLRALARAAGLEPLDVELMVVALAPDVDPRFEKLYGYLNDDVTRRRASVGLALQLAGSSTLAGAARARLEPSRPLLRHGLLVVEDIERPLLTRALRAPDRVTAHLLGDDAPAAELTPLLSQAVPCDAPLSAQLGRALGSGVLLVHLRERVAGTGSAVAVAALRATGRAGLVGPTCAPGCWASWLGASAPSSCWRWPSGPRPALPTSRTPTPPPRWRPTSGSTRR